MSFLTIDGWPHQNPLQSNPIVAPSDASASRPSTSQQTTPDWPLRSPEWPLSSPQWPFEDIHSLVHPPQEAAIFEDRSDSRRGQRVDTPEVYQLLFGNNDGDDGGNGSAGRPPCHSHRSPFWWTPEILCLVLGYAYLAVILVVLANANGKPPPEWPFGATLNTFLALFTSLAKMAFMVPVIQGLGQLRWLWFLGPNHKPLYDFYLFDEASRGAYGSLRLLLKLKGWLACLAAAITLSGFLTSTATQQVIQFPSQLEATSDIAASVAISRKFSLYNGGDDLSIPNGEANRFKQAILNAAYTSPNEELPGIAPECPSGDCQFPQYSSLGVCAMVANLTAQGNSTTIAKLQSMAVTQFTAMSNLYHAAPKNAISDPNLPSAYPLMLQLLFQPTSAFDAALDDLVISDLVLAYSDSPIEASNSVDLSSIKYLEVAFHWCANAFETQVQGGRQNTTVVQTSTNKTNTVPYNVNEAWVPDLLPCLIGNCSSILGNVSLLLASPIPGERDLEVHVWSALAMSSVLDATMDDTMFIDETKKGILLQSGGGVAQAFVNAIYGDFYSTTSLSPVDQIRNVQGIASNIAVGVTNLLRTIPPPGGQPATLNGTTLSPQVHVHIRWPWLSLLAAQLLLASGFLMATIIRTHISKVQILKGSALATLSGLDRHARERFGGINDYESLANRARTLKVRLELGPSGTALWLSAQRREQGSSWGAGSRRRLSGFGSRDTAQDYA